MIARKLTEPADMDIKHAIRGVKEYIGIVGRRQDFISGNDIVIACKHQGILQDNVQPIIEGYSEVILRNGKTIAISIFCSGQPIEQCSTSIWQ